MSTVSLTCTWFCSHVARGGTWANDPSSAWEKFSCNLNIYTYVKSVVYRLKFCNAVYEVVTQCMRCTRVCSVVYQNIQNFLEREILPHIYALNTFDVLSLSKRSPGYMPVVFVFMFCSSV